MLSTLRIKNLALAADLTIDLQPGLNVITGETGAGKSLLIGALSLVLGERADRDWLRSGEELCAVEVVFDGAHLPARLTELLRDNGLEPCDENQLVLKRSFTSVGANRQFVNGSPTTLAVLAKLGDWLVDIHGPHEHQSLLHPARQLEILDASGGLQEERQRFAALVRKRTSLCEQKAGLIVDERTYAQQLDLLRFQAGEISAAALRPGEDAAIEAEHRHAANAARLLELSQNALETLAGDEASLMGRAGALGRTLQELQRIDPAAGSLSQMHAQLFESVRGLQAELSQYAERLEIDPGRLQQVEERLNLLQSLKRKYGPSLNDVIAFGEEAERKLRGLQDRDVELQRINAELKELEAELLRAGNALSARRRKLIPAVVKAVGNELAELGFKQSQFDVLMTRSESPAGAETISRTGFDRVEFQFAPNPGEAPRPLRAIASSGELARVMLALKTVLAAVDQVPVLIFDEVDANIGGETAHAVGQKMRQIGRVRQVICITHLPQVAAQASAHFAVSKEMKGGRTYSQISLLNKKERITELARMLGGQSEAATKHAQALLA